MNTIQTRKTLLDAKAMNVSYFGDKCFIFYLKEKPN